MHPGPPQGQLISSAAAARARLESGEVQRRAPRPGRGPPAAAEWSAPSTGALFTPDVLRASSRGGPGLPRRRKLQELESVHNAYGGLAIDWRQRRRLERELAALQRMVATGARLSAEDTAEQRRISAFKQAVGLPAGEGAGRAGGDAAGGAGGCERRGAADAAHRGQVAPPRVVQGASGSHPVPFLHFVPAGADSLMKEKRSSHESFVTSSPHAPSLRSQGRLVRRARCSSRTIRFTSADE